jgi:hypothetical protein
MKTAAVFVTCILMASVFTSCASNFDASTIDLDQVQVAMVEYTAPYGIYVTRDGTSAQITRLNRLSKLNGEVQGVSLSVFQGAVEKHINSIAATVRSKAGVTLDINRLKDELEKSVDAPSQTVTNFLGSYKTFSNIHCMVFSSGRLQEDVHISWQTTPTDEIYAVIQFAPDANFNKTGKGELVPRGVYFVKKDLNTGKITAVSKSISLQ